MSLLEKENLLTELDNSEAIGNWLLTGFYHWPDYEKPWTQAFPPVPLHDDLYLERQLVSYSLLSTQSLGKALLWSLNQWIESEQYSNDQNSFRVLKGLLNMVVEIKQIERFDSIFWRLLTETPKAEPFQLKIVNILATLAPDPVAIKLLDRLKNDSEKWKPDYAPLVYIAKITHKPECWSKYLREFRKDFNSENNKGRVVKKTLSPSIFFSYVVNTLGIPLIAAQLGQLQFNTIWEGKKSTTTPDQWFVENLLGESNSPLFALKDGNNKWYLTKSNDYPLGEKVVIEFDNDELERCFKGYNDENRCALLVTKLVSLFDEKEITEKEFEKEINELSNSFDMSHLVNQATKACGQIDPKRKQTIQKVLGKLNKPRGLKNSSKPEEDFLTTICYLRSQGYPLFEQNAIHLLSTIKNIDKNTSPDSINEIFVKLVSDGFLLNTNGRISLPYSDNYPISSDIDSLPEKTRDAINEPLAKLEEDYKYNKEARNAMIEAA